LEIYNLLVSSDYTGTFNQFSIAKTDFDLQQQNTTLKVQTEGFLK
jgi:NTE family protein